MAHYLSAKEFRQRIPRISEDLKRWGEIIGWLWNFGDSTTSTLQNPFHNSNDPGTYTISLTVTGPTGSDTESKTNFIRVWSEQMRLDAEAFVTRFDQLCLGRDPDAAGLEGWANNLLNQIQTGADVAKGFIFSPEFIDRNTTNAEYLTILYEAFLTAIRTRPVGIHGFRN